MAKATNAGDGSKTNAEPETAELVHDDAAKCGIVMPISGMPNHSDRHWGWVKDLLHRTVRSAGLEPVDVWTGSAADRITTRILQNLFASPVVICDISGLNPNVMVEVGMRLTSKRPTIIVADDEAKIPFDIADFQVVKYPRNLNYIEMETFFRELCEHLTSKLERYKEGSYKPFLDGVTIDVIEPQTRSTTLDELIDRRFDELATRIDRIGRRVEAPLPPTRFKPQRTGRNFRIIKGSSSSPIYLALELPNAVPEPVLNAIRAMQGVEAVEHDARDGLWRLLVFLDTNSSDRTIAEVDFEADRLISDAGLWSP